ncbi:helix-turn-helix transcriptional regulator [Actinomycetospora flava]|uniref:Helix-turn-helix transcriptional regulator n=1 Tax=Actinomycetospora flava TaxID=3129232 RepID=A0ABU8MA75_9PSEU
MPRTESSPVARFDVRSRDPEFAVHDISGTYAEYTARFLGSREGFSYVHSGVVAPGFALMHLEYGMATELRSEVSPEDLMVCRVTGGELSVSSGQDVVRAAPGAPTLLPPDRSGWTVELDDLRGDAVMLDRAAVDRAAAASGVEDGRLTFTSRTAVSPAAARYWDGVVDHVRRIVLADDDLAASRLVLGEATRALAVAALVMFADAGHVEDRRRSDRAEPAVLRRALAFIDEHAGEDIGVEDIAAASGVGARGLQQVFRRHRDTTPLAYLRRARMSRAHGDLVAADPTRGDTVGAIAARWAFTNPGRFSVEYRRIHGCSPSETLRH